MGVVVEELVAILGLKADKESFEVGDKLLEHLKHATEAFLGFEGIKKLGEMIEGVEEQAVGAERLAQKIGVSTDAVQELGYAAKVTGVSTEELQVGFMRLARGVDEFTKKGSGEAAKAFERLGITAKDLKGESLDQNLELIATKFAKLPDGATKTALAMDIFGRSGANLIPLLNKGQAGIVELRHEAEKLGVVIDKDSIEKFHKLEETQKRIGAAWDGIKIQLAEALLPTISDLAEGVFGWIEANRELIEQGLEDVVEALTVVARGLGAAISFVVDVIGFLNEHSTLAKAALIGLAGAFIYAKGEAIISGAATALAWAAATFEFLLLAAAIAAVGFALYELADNADEVADAIESALTAAWDAVVGAFDAAVDGIEGAFFAIVDGIKGAFESMLNWVIDRMNDVLDAWNDTIGSIPGIGGFLSVGEISHVGGGPSAVATAITPSGGAFPGNVGIGQSAAAQIGHQENHNTVTIHAQNADAEEVGRIVRKELDDRDRQAHALAVSVLP